MKQLKEKILWCLNKFPETRNSDIKLTNCIWINFYNESLFKDDKGDYCVRLLNIYNLPVEDHVRRIRAKIQNEQNLFLPTDEKVRLQRKISELKWREFLNYTT